jgi:glutathione S-transferase
MTAQAPAVLALYHAAVSTCSQRVRMALAEKGLAWESRCLSLAAEEHLTPAYLSINPDGLVPALVHGGRVIADSTVILEYLEDVFPQVPLRPALSYERARMRMWQQFIDEVPTPATRIPSFQQAFGKHLRALSPQARRADAARRPLREPMYRKFGDDGFAPGVIDEAMAQLELSFARAEQALRASEWLAGEMLTLADISLLPTAVRMVDLGLTRFLEGRPAVLRWYEALQARPSFAQAYFPQSRLR